MKTPFTLEAWLKDKSQKVVDEDGRPVRIICTDADGLYPIIGLVNNKTPLPCGKDGRRPYIGGGGGTLFLVTPEEKLTEFEDGLRQICEDAVKESAVSPYRTSEDFAKRHSAELLALAREELFENDTVLKEYAQVSREQGKAEALRTRATELTKNLANSGLDEDSIPYHLIEFMCNLYTCRNWKEIEETAEAYVTRIKSAAMKGLPRWKSFRRNSQDYPFFSNCEDGENCLVFDGKCIKMCELLKLPGFNE